MDMTSLINVKLSSIRSNEQNTDRKLESIKNDDLSRERKKAAEEMESLFALQLIKTMRETVNSLSEDNKSSGNDTYMSMFDIEISKLFAKRGMGMQDSILNWLERMPVSANTDEKIENED